VKPLQKPSQALQSADRVVIVSRLGLSRPRVCAYLDARHVRSTVRGHVDMRVQAGRQAGNGSRNLVVWAEGVRTWVPDHVRTYSVRVSECEDVLGTV